MRRAVVFVLFVFRAVASFGLGLEIPLTDESDIIDHHWFSLEYNEEYEQADWVAYELTRDELSGVTARRDNFRVDPCIETDSAEPADYRKSGFDRGHLVPAGDLKMSPESMDASFLLSNISPQVPAFNRGAWLELENFVRTWAWEYEKLFIVTGPLFISDDIRYIGKNDVAVPDYFFKVVLDFNEDYGKAAGFILPNTDITAAVKDFIVSIDSVEELTGLDFYPLLPDDIEERLEASADSGEWIWKEFSFREHGVEKSSTENKPEPVILDYWINSNSGTRHNSSCEYYGNTSKGYYTDKKEGKACGRCGG